MLIFDFDGTLIETSDVVYDLWRRIATHFEKDLSKQRFRRVIIPDWQKFVQQEFNKDWRQHISALNKNFSWYKKQIESIPIKKTLINFLKNQKFGIVSSSFKNAITKKCKQYGLRPVFIYSSDTIGASSKNKLLDYALKKSNLRPEDCLYVCDTQEDITAAKSLGINTIAVTWGFHDVGRLSDADDLVHTKKELIKLLKNKYAHFL